MKTGSEKLCWIYDHPPLKKEGQVERVRLKMALLAAVGEYAVTNGLLPWQDGEPSRICRQILEAWLGQRGGLESHEVLEVENRLIRFMEAHGSSRFEHVESKIEKELWQEVSLRKNENTYAAQDRVPTLKNTVTHNRVGFRRWASLSEDNKEKIIEQALREETPSLSGVVWEYFFLTKSFDVEIINGLSDKECKSHLVSKGYLIPTLKDGKIVSYSRSTYIPGYGQKQLYHICFPDEI